MSIPGFNQLEILERQLYRNRAGMNLNCPSYFNGYVGGAGLNNSVMNNMNYYNLAFRGGYTGQDVFTQQNDATAVYNQYKERANSDPIVDWNNPSYTSLTDDLNECAQYYIKNSAPSESFMGAAVGGAAFGLLNNPRTILHPFNTLKTSFTGNVNKVFAEIKDTESALSKLYNNKAMYKGKLFEGGYELVSEAYARMHKLESLKNSKLGWFRRSLSKQPELLKQAETIEKQLANALQKGEIENIARLTEEAKRIGNAFTGFIPKGLRNIGMQDQLTWLRKKINPSQYEEIGSVVSKNIAECGTKSTLSGSLLHSCKLGNGLFFAAFEFLNDLVFENKIQKAFDKDSATGWKQVGQTTAKGLGSAVGWAVGEGIGAWAGAKIGAAAGTAICPGVGTAIGAVAGLVGGSIGSWLMGKVVHKIIGADAGTVAEAEKMKQTAQGQVQLLQLTARQAEGDKNLNPRTLQAINNIANFYGAKG